MSSSVLRRGLIVSGAAVTVAPLVYLNQENENSKRLKLFGRSVYRIVNLLGTTTLMGMDYAVSLAWYNSIAHKNELQSEYEVKYSALQQLQGRQQTAISKLQQYKREYESQIATTSTISQSQFKSMVQMYNQQIQEIRYEMDSLARDIQSIRHGNESDEGYEQFHSRLNLRNARRLRDLCATNGGIYIKIGQHIALLDHVVPPEYHDTLCSLLANTPTTDEENLRAVIQEDLGKPIEDLFDTFDFKPIGSASLAQVHIAFRDGQKLAVKIQHRHLREGLDVDLKVITWIVKTLRSFFPHFRYEWLTKEINLALPKELDFHNEVRNMLHVRSTLKPFLDNETLAIPIPQESLCSARVLTMTFEEGVYLSNVRHCERYSLDAREISSLLSTMFGEMIFKHGFVHCDLHDGNLLVRPHPRHPHRPQLVLLDHGLYRQLDDTFRKDYARLWQSIILANDREIEKIAHRLHVGEWFSVLTTVLTMKPWDDIIAQDSSKLDSQIDASELLRLQAFGRQYYDEIIDLLAVVPADLLLLLKANDGLRHLDRLLHTPSQSTAIVGRIAAEVVFEDELQAIASNDHLTVWDRSWLRLGAYSDYWRCSGALQTWALIQGYQQSIGDWWTGWNQWTQKTVKTLTSNVWK